MVWRALLSQHPHDSNQLGFPVTVSLLSKKCLSSYPEALEIREKWVMSRKNYSTTSVIANPTVSWRLDALPLQWLEIHETWYCFLRPGQGKYGKKNHKDLHGIRIRKKMVRKGHKNGKKCSRSDILGRSGHLDISYFSS